MIFNIGMYVLVGVAAVRHFGWLDGLAIVAALWCIAPWAKIRTVHG